MHRAGMHIDNIVIGLYQYILTSPAEYHEDPYAFAMIKDRSLKISHCNAEMQTARLFL